MDRRPSYYMELQAAMRELLAMVAGRLPSQTVSLVEELIDANECGVALETLAEMLEESHIRVSDDGLVALSRLVAVMSLDEAIVERARSRGDHES